MLNRLRAYFGQGLPVRVLDPLRARCVDASDLVDTLPSSPARSAAWAAYALETYGEALLEACARDGHLDFDTARVVRLSFTFAGICVEVARGEAGDVPRSLPRWHTVPRSHEQLVGMREALETLRTYLAYDGTETANVDAQLAQVDRLWIEHAPPEIRGGIGDALTNGLDLAYETGRRRFAA